MWRALTDDPAARELLREAVATVDADERTFETRALVHGYAGELAGTSDRTSAALERMLTQLSHRGPQLFGGICGIGWTIAHLTDEDTTATLCAPIDRALLELLATPYPGDVELVLGLVGIGVYALERNHDELASRVLDQLEARAQPRGAGVAWFTPPEVLPAPRRAVTPEGCWNLGLAHGIAGVIALCARFVTRDIAPERSSALADAAIRYLLGVRPRSDGPRFPRWDASNDGKSSPLAWCYGDFGTSLGLHAAGVACARADWRDEGKQLALACLDREPVHTGAHLCHGSLGAMHIFHRWYHATGDERFLAGARAWLARSLAILKTDSQWRSDPTLLEGAPGIALALAAALDDTEPAWDRLLLADI